MKKKIHPPYQEVLFVDSSTGFKFLCGSTLQSQKTEMYQGKEYPVHYVSVSSASHPFFTGSNQYIDTEGRVDKFLKRYAKKEDSSRQQQQQQQEESTDKKKGKKGKAK